MQSTPSRKGSKSKLAVGYQNLVQSSSSLSLFKHPDKDISPVKHHSQQKRVSIMESITSEEIESPVQQEIQRKRQSVDSQDMFTYIDPNYENQIKQKRIENAETNKFKPKPCQSHVFCPMEKVVYRDVPRDQAPYPLTDTVPASQIKYLKQKYGNTGPARQGYKVLVTDESLNLYLSQQYGFHYDKVPQKGLDFNHIIDRKRPRSNKGIQMDASKRRGSMIESQYQHIELIPQCFPSTMKDRLSLVIVEQRDEQEKIKKFVTELMAKDPHKRMPQAIEDYYKLKGEEKKNKFGDKEDIASKKKIEQFKSQRKVGVKGAALCSRLQSQHLSLMDLQDAVLKQIKKHRSIDQQQSLIKEFQSRNLDTIVENDPQAQRTMSLDNSKDQHENIITIGHSLNFNKTVQRTQSISSQQNITQFKNIKLRNRICSAKTGLTTDHLSYTLNNGSIKPSLSVVMDQDYISVIKDQSRFRSIPVQNQTGFKLHQAISFQNQLQTVESQQLPMKKHLRGRSAIPFQSRELGRYNQTLSTDGPNWKYNAKRSLKSPKKNNQNSQAKQSIISTKIAEKKTIITAVETHMKIHKPTIRLSKTQQMRILNDLDQTIQVKFGPQNKQIAPQVISRVEVAKSLFMEKLQKQGKFKPMVTEAQRLEIILGSGNTELTTVRRVKQTTEESPRKQSTFKNSVESAANVSQRQSFKDSTYSKLNQIECVDMVKCKPIIDQIQIDLDNEIFEQPLPISEDEKLFVPDLKMTLEQLRQRIQSMDDPKFWLQQGLKCAYEGKIAASMDYYRQGLRKNPTSLSLIYNLAQSYKKLNLCQNTLRWFQHGVGMYPKWVDGLCGLAMMHYQLKDYETALKFIQMAKENYAKKQIYYDQFTTEDGGSIRDSTNHKSSSVSIKSKDKKDEHLMPEERIIFIETVLLKMTNQFQEAQDQYLQMTPVFTRQIGQQIVREVFGLIVLLINDDKKKLIDHVNSLKETLQFFVHEKIAFQINVALQLRKYCFYPSKDNEEANFDQKTSNKKIEKSDGSLVYSRADLTPPFLNWEKYELSIKQILGTKSFFKRFTPDQLMAKLSNAQVEYYENDAIIFVRGKVGIISTGSVVMIRHSNNEVDGPNIIKKGFQGDIINFYEGDDGTTSNPLTWFKAGQNGTEIVFIEETQFKELWKLQTKMTEQQIVLKDLDTNENFEALDLTTKYALVFECMEQKVFFPGEMIVSVSERSPICTGYYPYYTPRISKFKRDMQQKKVEKKKQEQTEVQIKFIQEEIAIKAAASLEILAEPKKDLTDDQTRVKLTTESDSDSDMGLSHARQLLTEDKKLATEEEKEFNTSESEQEDDTNEQITKHEAILFGKTHMKKMFSDGLRSKLIDDRIKTMKFTLSKTILNMAEQNKQTRDYEDFRLAFKKRKNLIMSIDWFLKERIRHLTINKKLPENQRKSFTKIITSFNDFNFNMQKKIMFDFFNRMQTNMSNPSQTKAGFQHMIVINQLQQTISYLLDNFCTKNSSKTHEEYASLQRAIIMFIKVCDGGWGHKRVDSDGIHFMHQGTAVVVDEHRAWVLLSKCDCFGLSPISNAIGPDKFGDVRAGINVVSTFFVKYQDLYRRLSFIERARLQRLSENNKNLEVLITQFAQHYKLKKDEVKYY